MVNKAVFLDRDGVINFSEVRDGKPYAPRKVEDFIILDGVEEAIANIRALGYLVLVVTNQPDINNNLVEREEIDAMHRRLGHLPIEKIYVCPHTKDEGCSCRKPKPGMLLQAQAEFGIDLSKSFMIGDRQGDMQASEAAGCTSIFIDRKYRETKIVNYDFICYDLAECYELLLRAKNVGKSEN